MGGVPVIPAEYELLQDQKQPGPTRILCWLCGLLLLLVPGGAWGVPQTEPEPAPMPWRAAGLDEYEAAAHLLRRLTYGSRPGEVLEVVAFGLDNWIERQLSGDSPGPEVKAALARYEALQLDAQDVVRRYPHHARVVAEAIDEGKFSREAFEGALGAERMGAAQAALEEFAESRGYRPIGQVVAQLRGQKIYRALLSRAQLREVLTDLWFNHFNVTAEDSETRRHVLSYEQDAIRPHVLGSFRDLLGATARHPAMLIYLGNARSVAEPTRETSFDQAMKSLGEFSPLGDRGRQRRIASLLRWRPLETRVAKHQKLPSSRGLNENYARELLELHSLGVDGGYTQQDVEEVARAFTGWTTLPQRKPRPDLERALHLARKEDLGFVVQGQFLFRPDHHDAEGKKILGVEFPPGQGIEDGEQVLDLVARHPATARRVATKLATRFVSDDPPAKLVARLAETFLLNGGDLREVMRALLRSPEFWREARKPTKLKTPFELAISSLRGLDARVERPGPLIDWLRQAGQPLYAYAAPTGYPDRLDTWANVGSALARINLGLEIARGRLRGVRVDLDSLLGAQPLTTYKEAVEYFLPMLLPERELSDELWRRAGLADRSAKKLDEAEEQVARETEIAPKTTADARAKQQRLQRRTHRRTLYAVALLIASPEFQYR